MTAPTQDSRQRSIWISFIIGITLFILGVVMVQKSGLPISHLFTREAAHEPASAP